MTQPILIKGVELDAFTLHYLECMLWSSTGDDNEPLDKDHCFNDCSIKLLKEAKRECEQFQRQPCWIKAHDDNWWTAEQGGHDFWLTRNGHGTGFWDRYHTSAHNNVDIAGYILGEELHELSQAFGSIDAYIGDDNLIYTS